MTVTQSSSVAGTIYAKVIEQLVIAYQYDDVTITPYFRFKSIVEEKTATAGFPRAVKSTGPVAGTPTNESTAIVPIEWTTTNTDVAVGRVGISREPTETAVEDSVVAQALSVAGLIADAAKLYGEYFDTTAAALFSSVTAEAGATGTTLSIPTMVSLIGSQRSNKAKGPLVISLHDNQTKQLQQAQAAATSTPWQTFFQPNADGGAFGGYFMGAPIWSSGLNPTSTGDRLGCCWVDGQARPEFCAFAFVVKRLPSSKTETNILADSNIWASFARTGHGIVANNFATRVRSLNS
jgi:hypothetical protein